MMSVVVLSQLLLHHSNVTNGSPLVSVLVNLVPVIQLLTKSFIENGIISLKPPKESHLKERKCEFN